MRMLPLFLCTAILIAILEAPAVVTAQENSSQPLSQQNPPAATPAPANAAPAAPQPQNQPAPRLTDYSKSRPHLPNPLDVYVARHVPEAFFGNSPRIDQLLQNGKIMLSLDDAIALALENNLDLAIARYNLSIADTDILLAKAGQATRGVASGVVQGTPGGGVGGFGTGAQGAGAGGTTSGAGGAGAGASGLVTSTLGAGPAVESFDPFLSGTIQFEQAKTPSASAFSGVPVLSQDTRTANFFYNQGYSTGTALQVGFQNTRAFTNNPFTFLNPQLNSSFRAQLTQHLLQGLGLLPQRRFIKIAKNNRKISDSAFRQQIATTIPQIENIYWDLVNAYENVKVQERSVALAQKTLSDTEKQVQIGTLAPIQVTQARSVLATDQQTLIVAQTNLQLQQSLMKNAILRTIPAGPITDAQVIPTDTMEVPAEENLPPINALIDEALKDRPEIEQSLIDLKNRDITQRAARNELLPSIDLFGFYGGTGLAGVPPTGLPVCTPGQLRNCVPAGTSLTPSGYGTAFSNTFNGSSPDKGLGFNVTIPILNRAAQADSVRSQLEYRQAELRLEQLKNQVGIDVRNAQFALEQNRALVKAAGQGEQFAEQNLDAEQKKYALGASTVTLVLQAQAQLAQAQSQLVSAQTAYEKSRVELDRVTGQTLAHNNIHLDQAEAGVVSVAPAAPYVVPAPPEAQQPPNMQPPATQPQMENPPPQPQENPAPPQQENPPQPQQPQENPQPQR